MILFLFLFLFHFLIFLNVKNGTTPLYIAAFKGHEQIIQILLKKGEPNVDLPTKVILLILSFSFLFVVSNLCWLFSDCVCVWSVFVFFFFLFKLFFIFRMAGALFRLLLRKILKKL